MKLVATKFYITALHDDRSLDKKSRYDQRTIKYGYIAQAIKTSILIALITVIILIGRNHKAFCNPLTAGGVVVGLSLALFASKIARILNYPDFITWHMKDANWSRPQGARHWTSNDIANEEGIALAIFKIEKVTEMEQALGRKFTEQEHAAAYEKVKNLTLPEAKKAEIAQKQKALSKAAEDVTYDANLQEKHRKKAIYAVMAGHCLLAIAYIVLSSLKMKNFLTNQQFAYMLMAPLLASPLLFEAMTRYFTVDYDQAMRQAFHQRFNQRLAEGKK